MSLNKPDIYQANLCPPCPPDACVFDKAIFGLGIGLGSGMPKKAAGTWGTLAGCVVALPVMLWGFLPFLSMTLLGCVVGSYICGKTSALMNVHDDPHIVFDEWVGMWIALLPSVWWFDKLQISLMANWHSLFLTLVLPFVLFRFFDIIKPFPIRWVDRQVSGGFGILLDDVLAGVMTLLIMMAIGWWLN